MNNAKYQRIKAISSHWLIAMLESPAACWRKYLSPQRPIEESSEALRFGTLVHMLALTPNKVDDEFIIADYERRSKAGKERYAQLCSYGLTVVKPAELSRAMTIVAALKANSDTRKLLMRGRKERMIIQPRDAGLLPLKARLDVHHEAKRQVVELKTTRDLNLIRKAFRDYGYLLSAAFYQRISKSRIVFIFVQTTVPYEVEIFEPAYWQLDQGREQYQSALQQFDECWRANHWPEAAPAPAMDDDPLMMDFMTTNLSHQRLDLPCGELDLALPSA